MTNENKKLGKLGGKMVTSAMAITGGNFYQLYVDSDAVFTVLKEQEDKETSTDVISEQNLTGLTVHAGTIITPRKDHFESITISSGQVYAYKNK